MSVNIGSRNRNKMFIINAPDEEEKCTEAQLDILLKINTGEYRLVKKNKRSSVWNVYREIARADGTKLKWRYFCLGCKRVMQSSGGTTSNLRIHKCHVRYIKQGGSHSPSGDASNGSPSPRAAAAASQTPRSQQSSEQRAPVKRVPTYASQYEQLYEVRTNPLAKSPEMEEDTEENNLEEEADGVDQIIESERILEEPTSAPKPRPLLKLFSEDSWSCEPELDPDEPEPESVLDEQTPIELDHNDIQQEPVGDYKEEILQPKGLENSNQFNASALSEAESYAKSWAHAFLRLSDEQKFYAKRSIDELLVLGRLEKLSISTVTSLTTNL
ncbi:uncharacterized protein [Drosophila kikkawai]|uniref:BED-type domain-containing protein n=1 Tax=Drosophila kikkawai TaxID=30033 RepID=A0A6P4IFG9_DROKI|nr:uncharacterized protein LOC108073967 [Drosophila kikkawai]